MDKIIASLLRLVIAYLYLLIIVRISGKRVVKSGTPFDLIVALILSDFPDDMIFGKVPMVQGLVAAGTLMLLHLLVVYIQYRSIRFDQLIGSGPAPVIQKGKLMRENMALLRLNDEELDALLRGWEIDQRSEVRDANVEPSGKLTVNRRPEAKPAQKRDRAALEALVK